MIHHNKLDYSELYSVLSVNLTTDSHGLTTSQNSDFCSDSWKFTLTFFQVVWTEGGLDGSVPIGHRSSSGPSAAKTARFGTHGAELPRLCR